MSKNLSANSRVSIVLLNWNNWDLTVECLESLYQSEYPNYDIIIVDNGSNDDSIEKIKEYCEGSLNVESKFFSYNSNNKPISILEYTKKQAENGGSSTKEKEFSKIPSNRKLTLILLKKNYGFTGGNNIASVYAIKALKPKYIFLLNNDTVLDSKLLSELIEGIKNDDSIGIAGPEIRNYYNTNLIQFGERYEGLKNPTEIDWVSGCAFMINVNLIKSIGLLDPIFFIYFEETDYILRAMKAGFKIVYVPTRNKIYHKYSATLKRIKGFILYYMTRNHIIFKKRHIAKKEFKPFLFNFFKDELKLHLNRDQIYYFLKGMITGIILSLKIKRL